MGCLQSSFLNDQQLDFSKNRSGEKSWTPADIPDDAIVPLELSEKLLVSGDASRVIQFNTQRNDIAPINKHEILSHANLISRHAVQKLLLRKHHLNDDLEIEFIFDKVSFMKEVKSKGGLKQMAKALQVNS